MTKKMDTMDTRRAAIYASIQQGGSFSAISRMVVGLNLTPPEQDATMDWAMAEVSRRRHPLGGEAGAPAWHRRDPRAGELDAYPLLAVPMAVGMRGAGGSKQ